MDLIKAANNYLDKLLNDVTGIKALLLDDSTISYISSITSQTNLLNKEIYLIDKVGSVNRQRISHLKCLVFVTPTSQSIDKLCLELSNPLYSQYYLYFSNTLTKQQIESLASSDTHSVVKECQELFLDYLTLSSSLFSLNFTPTKHSLYATNADTWDKDTLHSTTSSLAALLLSLKRKPIIRYQGSSNICKSLADSISQAVSTEAQLFNYRSTQATPILLLCDRTNDPVTPLLSQWTYQAMVHDLIGLDNDKVDLRSFDNISPSQKQLLLSLTSDNDSFYAQNAFANFGDLGANVKQYVNDYQVKIGDNHSVKNIETISDMKKFIESYPEMKKLGNNVSKHVTLIGELSKLVDDKKLLQVSELEQSLASNESHSSDLRAIKEMIDSPEIPQESKVRLSILYALRYQKLPSNAIQAVVSQLLQQGVPQHRVALVYVMLNLAGADKRQDDLFMNDNFFSRGRSALKGLQGVENVYTQHTPHLSQTLDLLFKGRLREGSYPATAPFSTSSFQPDSSIYTYRPQEVIVFIAGGTTYEEARNVALLNQQFEKEGNPSRVVLGGNTILNSRQFLDMMADAATQFPPTVYKAPTNTGNGQQQQLLGNLPSDLDIDPERLASAAKSWIQRVRDDIEDRIMI